MNSRFILILSLAVLLVSFAAMSREQKTVPVKTADTIQPDTQPAKISMEGKLALFIGDSHTSNHSYGWQKVLCDNTRMAMKNVSVGGKTTYWMLNQSVYAMNESIDIMFIYGGANDMAASSIAPDECIDNIQRMVNLGKGYGIPVVVMTGFDPKVITLNNPGYKSKYVTLQRLMLTHLKGCTVIDFRSSIVLKDCGGDPLCHMARSGHRKIAEKVIKDLNYRTFP